MSLKSSGQVLAGALVMSIAACTAHAPPVTPVTIAAKPPIVVAPIAPAQTPRARYDWIGIVGTGQSLSIGAGAPPITLLQPFRNRKVLRRDASWELAPLVEPIRARPRITDYQYPNNVLGETPHSALGNQLTTLAMADGEPDLVTIHSVVGWSGHCLEDIDKHGTGKAYPASLEEVRAMKALADAAHKTFAVGAVVLTHGECDSTNAHYADDLVRFAREYDADLRAITGQTETVPLVLSQQNTSPSGPVVSIGSIGQWEAGVQSPDLVVCAGPKYQYDYNPDGLHMDAPNYRRLGEKYAEVIDHVFRRRERWAPLQATGLRRKDRTIWVRFHVPDPPMQWDETLAPPHQGAFVQWANGRGFEVEDAHGPMWISRVAIDGDEVAISLRDPPTDKLIVRYATTQDAKRYSGGDAFGRRGQLRDSDAMIGWDAETIRCRVQHDSNAITAIAATGFEARSARDVAVADGLSIETIVNRVSGDTMFLSSPWSGPTGEADIAFHHDQRNYAVAFRIETKVE